jgi:nitroreductase
MDFLMRQSIIYSGLKSRSLAFLFTLKRGRVVNMDFFEALSKRRSIRKYTSEPVPPEVIERALDGAILAPNSSNLQTWDFYWVRTPERKAKLVQACLNQSAARTAAELLVITANPALWRRSNPELIRYAEKVNAPSGVKAYYRKLIPLTYQGGGFRVFYPWKWAMVNWVGIFRAMPRSPLSRRDLEEVAIKSAALAAENFVLAISAQGFSTCMMEGFDESRVKRLLSLKSSSRIVMVISVGRETDRGTWGPQFRLDREKVIHRV